MLWMKALFAHALVLLAMVEKSPNVSSLISDYLTSGKVKHSYPFCVTTYISQLLAIDSQQSVNDSQSRSEFQKIPSKSADPDTISDR